MSPCRRPDPPQHIAFSPAIQVVLADGAARAVRCGRCDPRLCNDSHEEAIQEALANCWVHYEKLHRQGRSEAAFPTSLAQFAIRQVRCGRTVATRLNSGEPLSRYAQQRHSITVQRLEAALDTDDWRPLLTEGRRMSVADQAALQIDTREWLQRLSHRLRQIACDLAMGFSNREVGSRYGLSPSRISQLRREFYESWMDFQGLLPAESSV